MENNTRKAYSLRNYKLTPFQRSIVIGHILGDGFLSSRKRSGGQYNLNSYLSIDRKASHRAYLSWTACALWPLFNETREYTRKKDGLPLIRLQTPAHPELSELRDIWYPDGVKVIDPLFEINEINPTMLAVWYMDDGTYWIDSRHEFAVLSTEGFGNDSQQGIADWFKSVVGVSPTVIETGFGGSKIRFGKKDVRKFLDIIEPHVHPVMRYKLGC